MQQIWALVIFLSTLFSTEGCNYYYIANPKTPTNCTVGGQNVTLSCGVAAPSDPSYDIEWYRSSEPAGSNGTATLLLGSTTQFDLLNNSTLRAFRDLVINSFSVHDSGYYWCQIVISNCSNSSELMRSQEALLIVGNQSNTCTEKDFVETYQNGVCAETNDFQGSRFPVASLTHESTATVFPMPTITTTPSDVTPESPIDFLKDNFVYLAIGGGAVAGILFCALAGCVCVCICRERSKVVVMQTGKNKFARDVAVGANDPESDYIDIAEAKDRAVLPPPNTQGSTVLYQQLDRNTTDYLSIYNTPSQST